MIFSSPPKISVFFRMPLRSGGRQQSGNNQSDTMEHSQLWEAWGMASGTLSRILFHFKVFGLLLVAPNLSLHLQVSNFIHGPKLAKCKSGHFTSSDYKTHWSPSWVFRRVRTSMPESSFGPRHPLGVRGLCMATAELSHLLFVPSLSFLLPLCRLNCILNLNGQQSMDVTRLSTGPG